MISKTGILTLMVMGVTWVSCSREPITYPEEMPLDDYLTISGFNENTVRIINSGHYEFGFQFKPVVDGMIKALRVKIPDNATDVRITIWDADSKEIIRTETIASVSKDAFVEQAITPVEMDQNHSYMITLNADDWYIRKRMDETPAHYPITCGNIMIEKHASTGGTRQTFPTLSSILYYAGDLDFVFQQTAP
ncbi:hypothetical protein ABDK00_016625 [Niabella insulamsoli]|uniref:hypothetical protein n=1 Tax=Niabella insulamsoli TaxID=3144874 RepID=UPI0031FBCE61